MTDPERYMRYLHDLSRLALAVLAAQKQYFRSRAQADLITSKQLEKQLRDIANSYLEVEQL